MAKRNAGLLRRLSREQIDAIFEKAQSQSEYIVELHRAVVPDFDQVERLDDYIECSQELGEYLFEKAIEWDKANHAGFPGGGWLNWGFSVRNTSLTGEEINLPTIKYKSGHADPAKAAVAVS